MYPDIWDKSLDLSRILLAKYNYVYSSIAIMYIIYKPIMSISWKKK